MPSDPLAAGPGGGKPPSEQETASRVPPQAKPPVEGEAPPEAPGKAEAEARMPAQAREEAGAPPPSEPPREGAISRGTASVLVAAGDTWGSVLAFACASIVLGFVVLAWPAATLQVVAVVLGLQLLVYGFFSFVQTIAFSEAEGGRRLLHALLGVLAVIAGVLALRNITGTIMVLAVILGLFWLVGGAIAVMSAFVGRARTGRGLTVITGLLGMAAGIVVLVYPSISLGVLVTVLGIWLVVFGALTAATAYQMRNAVRRENNRRKAAPAASA
ncbi:HdeD family acid-resistance protein [Actinopolymorpha alba]|uniref:HdeD family acid-resistance protein n=1 Tax=Actinopolymorpha alba TaxID=533267 RepID=UPI00036C844A|nr:HdeD family acid-resistance protein [Actinopolymorpha alba]